ncbi:MAG TPA: hypothetical protein VJ861_04765 [Treponemataceae bacterium]|nr:hypothetical protein [Treponemataceae bacterium]
MIKNRNTVSICLLSLGCFFLVSCTTMRTNYFLIADLENEKKAELLFEQSKESFKADVIEKKEYSKIKAIRTAFTDVLKLDPTLVEAEKLLTELDIYVEKNTTEYKKKITALSEVQKRTRPQNYEYLIAIQRITELDSKNKEMKQLKKETATLRDSEITLMVEELSELHGVIMADKNQVSVLKRLKIAHNLIDSISTLTPSNKEVLVIKEDFNMKINEFVENDITIAKQKLEQKQYYDAEGSILKAEKTLSTMTSEPSTQVQDLKYKIYFNWASQYYATAKYQSAGYRANQALSIYKTNEAYALKTKINKAASVRDYDAEITDIISSVDSLLDQDKLSDAMNIIQANTPRMKKQANVTMLNEKKNLITQVAARIYKEGVTLYTEEDYERAALKFSAVVAFDKEYEQARSYLDKATTKFQALQSQ